MALLHLNLSDELQARLQSRARESGYESVEQYAREILQADAQEQTIDEALESMLIARLEDARPSIEMTREFEEQFRRQTQSRQGK